MQGNLEVSGAIVGNLDDLDDVVITAVADDEVLKYDSATGNWTNQTDSGGSTQAQVLKLVSFRG